MIRLIELEHPVSFSPLMELRLEILQSFDTAGDCAAKWGVASGEEHFDVESILFTDLPGLQRAATNGHHRSFRFVSIGVARYRPAT
jgi:hypothetical protein